MSVEHSQSIPATVIQGPIPNQELKKSELIATASAVAFDMHKAGLGNTSAYSELYYTIATADNKFKEESDIDREKLIQILRDLKALPPSLPEPDVTQAELADLYIVDKNDLSDEVAAPVNDEVTSATQKKTDYVHVFESEAQAREIQAPEQLTDKEMSKKYYSAERAKLAAEIKAERRANRERLTDLQVKSLDLSIDLNDAQADLASIENDFQTVEAERVAVANSLAGRFRTYISQKTGLTFNSDTELQTEAIVGEEKLSAQREHSRAIEEEIAIVNELIETDTTREQIKEKLNQHYQKTGLAAERVYDREMRGVEQVMMRNKAFIVHVILTSESLRHNENSNVSAHTTLEDDVDILLSLEPSISTSTVMSGVKSGLWGEAPGVFLAGGEVVTDAQGDAGTRAVGIKHRYAGESSDTTAEQIDKTAQRKEGDSYNELVVDNPKVAGFFVMGSIDETGKLAVSNKSKAEEYCGLAAKRGLPAFIMTPDRQVFELQAIDEEGKVSIGKEVFPDDIARLPAGLSTERRLELGRKVMENVPFNKMNHHTEAHQILREFSGEDESTKISREEVLAAMRVNPDLRKLKEGIPQEYLSDPEFIKEVANFDAFNAFGLASQELKSDINFIKHLYEIYPHTKKGSLFSYLETELQENPEIQLLALKYDQLTEIVSNLKSVWLDSESVRNEFVSRAVLEYSSRFKGEEQPIHLHVVNIDSGKGLLKRAVEEFGLVDTLNQTNPTLLFYIDGAELFVKSKA